MNVSKSRFVDFTGIVWLFQRLQKAKLCVDSALMDECLLQHCLQYYATTAQLLIRLVTPANKQ